MRFSSSLLRALLAGCLLFSHFTVPAQSKEKSYKSLLWEITGNGLTRPSYLFGTMHISNKMVFHLSDSFYTAIRNSDVVAIELNPEQWQSEIPRMSRQGDLFKYYNATYYTDYLRENSFTEGDFLSLLRESLRFEPALNDALLYRNENYMDNFQEDTYLDLYIYQTGKKLGKKTAGVETFMGSQRMMMEAMVDASAEKEKKRPDLEGTQYYELNQNLQDAYRRGDLDMLDSINKLTEYAQSFTEKFLYKRNEIQAASMDSIMKHQSLFVGVGAAHLPGKRGVIEILRKKGYSLRPIYMLDRDATQKKYIDSLTVPVSFTRQYGADSFYSVSVPGKLNAIESRTMNLEHYADMGNGSYYLITRIKANGIFNGFSEQKIMKIVDSLLYENIPGTILSNKTLTRNGYPGMDIINRTRKGDLQHYQLFFTPSELFVFKVGGKGSYVSGKEAETFFSSITFKEQPVTANWKQYSPASGGFSVQLPAEPQVFHRDIGGDNLPEWKYEAMDPVTSDRFAIFRKSIYSFEFIDADTFDLMLIAESFGNNEQWEDKKIVSTINDKGRPVKEMSFRSKDGAYIRARAVLFGPQYYLLVHRSLKEGKDAATFFNSFGFTPFRYPAAREFTDTSLHFSVKTVVKPVLDADIMDMMLYVKRSEPFLRKEQAYQETPEESYANFVSEETGEVVVVNHYKYPEYFCVKDSSDFWKRLFQLDSSMVLRQKTKLERGRDIRAWMMEWSDTGSTRLIRKIVLQQGMELLTATTMRDSTLPLSPLVADFSNTFTFQGKVTPGDLFHNKQELFFRDYYSKDTIRSKRAKLALPSVYFGKEGYPNILAAIRKLDPKAQDYYEIKTKFINELGYIGDSTITTSLARDLKQMYLDAGDTTIFQNSVLNALARLRTPGATAIFKELILQDPPAFENQYEYNALFSTYYDSLKLATALFPELMNLTSIEDFKSPVRDLLMTLLDSSCIKPAVYEDFVGNIYFDAKIALKKLQYSSESTKGQEGEDDAGYLSAYRAAYRKGSQGMNSDLLTYIRLLAPFYDKNPNLPKFFDKLLTFGNPQVRMNTALALLQNKQPVSDTIWTALAKEKAYRSVLWSSLQKEGKGQFFPKQYQTNEAVAASALYGAYGPLLDTLVPLNHAPVVQKNKNVLTYLFKYKQKQTEGWKLAFGSVTQQKGKPAEPNDDLVFLSNKKLGTTTADLDKQIAEQLKRRMIGNSNSGREFYGEVAAPEAYAGNDL